MGFIDQKGRLFGRVSVIDLLIVLAVLGLVIGYVYKRTSGAIQQIVDADAPFYVTFQCEEMRQFSVDALSEGDIFYKQYDRKPLGPVTGLAVNPTKDIMLKTDGTAGLAEMEGRFTAYITVQCTGSITDAGYYVNGSMHVAEGQEFMIHSNRLLVNARVYAIGTEES